MITTEYRIRIEALTADGRVIADFNQIIMQDTLTKSRPRQLITIIERFVRTFIHGHTEAERRLAKNIKRRKPKKLDMRTLMTGLPGLHP
jgi:phenylacetate-coenzyme A ligase PaaK-like adenylate-forming protein